MVMEYLLAQEHMTPAINLFMEELRLDLAKEVILEELKLQVLERMRHFKIIPSRNNNIRSSRKIKNVECTGSWRL